MGIVEADLKFLMQFHGLAGEGEFGGLAHLAHAVQQGGKVGLLCGGEVAGLAFGDVLADDVGGYFGEGGGGFGEVTGGQARGDSGVFVRGRDDEVAVVDDDGDGAVWFAGHGFFGV